ncbi:hypothetical protein UFOVP136_57 [uncultured Caudovirales phage]|uniref:Uncharacterized protein n=1 Tax=uncultured Caudovirales phage TaxID=2100421 RepID=A0A6J5LCA8_9CAUD|nr:hypothetical protein UFOVP136_57 [uncultured Caudovirales phage]
MCDFCNRDYPTPERLHALFYLHNGVLHRQHLPRSYFINDAGQTLYNKLANQPCKPFSKHNPNAIFVLGMKKPMQSGLVKSIMAGKGAAGWFHDGKVIEQDEIDHDEIIPPRFPKHANIPAKIYRNGFLTLRN